MFDWVLNTSLQRRQKDRHGESKAKQTDHLKVLELDQQSKLKSS